MEHLAVVLPWSRRLLLQLEGFLGSLAVLDLWHVLVPGHRLLLDPVGGGGFGGLLGFLLGLGLVLKGQQKTL